MRAFIRASAVDNQGYYVKICELLQEHNAETVISTKNQAVILENMQEKAFVDIWHLRHPAVRNFTFLCSNPIIKTRIDYFPFSNSLLSRISESEIIPCFLSDHVTISANITFDDGRGKGCWKLNCSILGDLNFCESFRLESKQYLEPNHASVRSKSIL